MKRGNLIIYCGPSGVGKGTVSRNFLNNPEFNIVFSVSATTRKAREGEIDGVNYHFLTKEQFEQWIEEGKFLEWAQFVDNYYGTPMHEVEKNLSEGKNVFLEIELLGVKQVIEKVPEAIVIFLLPPSIEHLKERLVTRNTESIDVIEKRVSRAEEEMEEILSDERFRNNVVINDDVERASEQIINLLRDKLN